ncbi:transmembrane protein, putative [Rhizoctonia solani AG-3 Rhs1AP]|uniref:Transmembrane protein, putative n=1 Tax=Rhizoctonia solani AG-3 Rhs1AP TaxID=1086054 RepID=X8JQY0_9AGAM|nr:transmembrane protein, putative [Rhizoctonia solani AG-3 Rhs1AP]
MARTRETRTEFPTSNSISLSSQFHTSSCSRLIINRPGPGASMPVVPALGPARLGSIPFAGTPRLIPGSNMARWVFAVVLSLAVSALASNDTAVHIHHRIRQPGSEPAPFSHRGTVLLTPTGPSYSPAGAFRDQLVAWISSSPDARYDIALETDGNPDDWPRSSVKLCHLTATYEEFLTLHKTVSGDIFALDYHLDSVPKNGACPHTPSAMYIASTDVQIKSPSPAFTPRLRVPPPMSSDGKPITPVPEQSFIQKYWMYIVPGLIILLVLPAGPDDAPQR